MQSDQNETQQAEVPKPQVDQPEIIQAEVQPTPNDQEVQDIIKVTAAVEEVETKGEV